MPRVLFVDGNEQIRRLFTTLLSSHGHQVFSASTGAEALGLVRENRPDIIVSAHQGPDIDGFGLCAEVRRDESLVSVPFLVLSSNHASEEEETLALRSGCDGFIRTQADPTFLLGVIEKHLSKPSEATQLEIQRAALRRAQEELNRQRKELEAGKSYNDLLLETTLDGHILADTEGKILHVNQAYCEMTGFTAGELLAMNIQELEANLDRAEIEGRIQEFVKKGRARFETQHRAKDGRLVDLAVQISVADSREGPLLAAFVRDISLQNRAKLERDWFFELSIDFMAVATFEGAFHELNPAWEKALGWSLDELRERPFLDFVHPDDRAETVREMRKMEAGKSSVSFSNRYRCRDGSYRTLAWNAEPLLDLGLIFAIARDVTSYEETLSSLRVSEERFRNLFERVPVSLWEDDLSQVFAYLSELRESGVSDFRAYLDENPEFLLQCIAGTKILNVNQASLDMFEASSKTDLLGSMGKIVTPASAEVSREVVVALAEGKEHFVGEGRATTLTGRPVDVLVSLHAPPPGSSSASAPALVSMVDITSRKRAEEALRDRERQLETLFKHLPGVAYRCQNDQDWTMELVSAGCETLTGHPAEALIGNRDLSWADLIHQEDQTAVWDSVQGGLDAGRPFEMVYRILTREGREKWVWEQGEAVLDDETGETVLEGFITDITQRVEAEEAESQAREELRALSRRLLEVREEERAALARELHDELGQTLTTLHLDIGVLSQTLGETRPEVTESLERMEETLDRNLVEVRGLSARLRPPILDLMGLGPAIEWQVQEIGLRSPLEFDLDLEDGDPDLPSGFSTAVFRIAQESLTNVIRHAEASRVSVTLAMEGPSLTLEIQDDGLGIEANAMAGTSSLGLVGMRERAMALDGSLKVERVETGGTRVSLRVPIP